MSKKKKTRKMTVKEELVESDDLGEVADTAEKMKVDNGEEDDTSTLSKPDNLLKVLENASSLKLVKKVIENSKELCKLLVGKGAGSGFHLSGLSQPELLQFSRNLSERVQKVCDKYSKSPDKAAKFFSKISSDDNEGGSGMGRLSCDSEMFRHFLKYGMNSPENSSPGGSSLVGILQGIFSVAACHAKVDNPTLGIQMIVSHSSAPNIFLESHQFLPKNHHFKGKQAISRKQDGGERENFPDDKTATAADKVVVVEEEKYSEIKSELLKLWKNLVIAFTKISKSKGTSNDKKILENSVPYLFQMYSATMSQADQEIYQILREYTGKRLQIPIEQLPLFGPKSLEPAVQKASNSKVSNPLFLHSNRANAILGFLNERQAYLTAMEYREENGESCNKNHYDIRFLLPLVCHVLDSKNICDAVRVISHGWIYLILRGLSLQDDLLRSMAFLGLKLLIQNFQLPKKGFKMQDIKVWLHFLLSIRQGLQNRGRCQVSNLLSTWMVASFECLRQPTHPLYPRLTNLLFAKPVIDLSVLPDFLPFFNAVDGNKATREWIMGILRDGLQTREDWQVGQRLPMINSLCSVFLVEKLNVQREIVGILCQGARIPEVAVDMVDRYGLLIWISNVSMEKNRWYGKELNELFRTLRESCRGMGGGEDSEREKRWEMLFEFVERKQGWMQVDDAT